MLNINFWILKYCCGFLLLCSVLASIDPVYDLYNLSAEMTIDALVMNSLQSTIFFTARPMNHNTGVDLALLVFDMISLKPLQSPLVFPGCTTVQSPVNSFLTTYPYFQSNDGIVQRSENLIVFCRNVTGSFMFEIVHQDNTWPNSWVVGRTWFAKASNVESLYTSFYSFQTPLSPNLGTQLVPQIGTSGKIYFLGSYQTRRVLLAVNLDTFQFEQVGMFAEGVIVLDLLAQLRPDGITVDWYVSTSDSKTYATALNKLSFSSLPSLALIPISPISPTPIGLEASFVLPLPLRPAVNLTPVLVRNSTGWVLTTNGDKLNPRPKIVQFDAATGAVGASAVVPNTYVAATAGISGLSKCGYVFGADLNLYHVNNTLTQVAFNDELKVLDSVTTQALGYWPSTANFLMLSTDSNVVVAFGSQLAKFSVTCSAY